MGKNLSPVRGFRNGDNAYFEYPYSIVGITKDSTGTPLANCPVVLFRTADNSVAGLTISDGSGNYAIVGASCCLDHYANAYKAGSPDVAGTTVNTLRGT